MNMKIRISGQGSVGKFNQERNDFVDYFSIPSPFNSKVQYVIYNRYPKAESSFLQSSNYWQFNMKKARETAENVSTNEIFLLENKSEKDLDTLIYNNFWQYGKIQVEVRKENDERKYFDLVSEGNAFFNRRITRKEAEKSYDQEAEFSFGIGCRIL